MTTAPTTSPVTSVSVSQKAVSVMTRVPMLTSSVRREKHARTVNVYLKVWTNDYWWSVHWVSCNLISTLQGVIVMTPRQMQMSSVPGIKSVNSVNVCLKVINYWKGPKIVLVTISQIAMPVLTLSCCTYLDIYGFVTYAIQHNILVTFSHLKALEFIIYHWAQRIHTSLEPCLDTQREVQPMLWLLEAWVLTN